ncbi:hypothetical protein D3C75_1192510 [compost metagenome]
MKLEMMPVVASLLKKAVVKNGFSIMRLIIISSSVVSRMVCGTLVSSMHRSPSRRVTGLPLMICLHCPE